MLFELLLCDVSPVSYLVCMFFKGRDSVPYNSPALPELSLLIFKALGVKSWFSKPNVMGLIFPVPGCLVWALILLLLCVYNIFPICGWSIGNLVLNHISAPPTLFNIAFSLWLAVEGVFCQSSGPFQSYLCRCSCYLHVSVGQGELRILPFCHPPKSQLLIL